MARVKIGSAIDALVNGAILQGAASATLYVPDLIYASALSAQLTNTGYTIVAEDFDQAAVIVSNSATIACNNGSETLMTWDTEASDLRGFHSTSSSTSRLTVPTNYAGLYFGFARISCPGSTTGRRQITVYTNGTATAVGQEITPAGVGNTSVRTCPFWAVLADGDYVEAKYVQDSGGVQNVTPVSFAMFRIVRT